MAEAKEKGIDLDLDTIQTTKTEEIGCDMRCEKIH